MKVKEIERAIEKGYFGEYHPEIRFLLTHIHKLEEGIREAIPCLEDWTKTTQFGAVYRRDKAALDKLQKLLEEEIKKEGRKDG